MSIVDAASLPPWLAVMFPVPRRAYRTRHGVMTFAESGSGRPVLFVHGNPTWSFLWRKVMARLAGEKLRLIAPDLLGCGTSERLARVSDHSLRLHGEALLDLVIALGLRDVVLVVQDWGGPIGTWVASQAPDRVSGLVLMNTAVLHPGERLRATAFHRFARLPIVSDVAFRVLRFPLTTLDRVQGDRQSISGVVKEAYAWPFRSYGARVAPLALARMVPAAAGHPTLAELSHTDAWFRGFTGPTELVWGTRDPILGRALGRHREAKPGARVTETSAGHFLQEEVPDEIAAAVRRVSGVSRGEPAPRPAVSP